MSGLNKILLGAACAFSLAISVVPASAQTTPTSGWYLRGDVGWSMSTNANIHDRNSGDHAVVGPGGTPGTLSDIGSGWFAGGGAGMQFSPNLRGDIAYTYRGGYQLDQLDSAATRFKGDFADHAVMATVYGDFPLDWAVPFVGFGLGWSQVNVSNLSATTGLAVNPLATIPLPAGTTVHALGGSSDNFAWQVTAGAGFHVSEGVIIDLFYRYFDAGHVQSQAGNVVTTGGTVVGTYHGAEGALHAHEFGASLRFPLGY
jgi:opacity protein-like surface antigen